MRRAHETLLADMREALLAELGAVSVYASLARRAPDAELRRAIAGLHEEELAQVARLRETIAQLGGRPRRRSWRRRLAARLLVASTRLLGPRFALRVCQEAEATVSRWYREYAVYLARVGELEAARTCDELSRAKARHASMLDLWVLHLPPRGG